MCDRSGTAAAAERTPGFPVGWGARSGGWHQPVAAGKDRMRKYVGCSLRCHGCAGRTGRAAQSATDATEV
ncbi:hypothetical protein JCM3263A_02010 [Thermobifida fusca]